MSAEPPVPDETEPVSAEPPDLFARTEDWRSNTRWIVTGVLFLLITLFPHHSRTHRHLSDSPPSVSVMLAGDWLLLALLFGASVYQRRRTGREPLVWAFLPRERRAIPEFVFGWGVGVLLLTAVVALLALAGCYHLSPPSESAGELFHSGVDMAVLFLGVGALEEILFRGIVFHRLARWMGIPLAAVVSSVVFAVVHVTNPGENPIGIFQVFVAGLLFVVIFVRTRTLWLAIGVHSAWDWSQNFLYSTPDSGIVLPHGLVHTTITGPAWLSGGTVGPEGSVVATIILLLAALGFWRAPSGSDSELPQHPRPTRTPMTDLEFEQPSGIERTAAEPSAGSPEDEQQEG